jgi:hypothetical protein
MDHHAEQKEGETNQRGDVDQENWITKTTQERNDSPDRVSPLMALLSKAKEEHEQSQKVPTGLPSYANIMRGLATSGSRNDMSSFQRHLEHLAVHCHLFHDRDHLLTSMWNIARQLPKMTPAHHVTIAEVILNTPDGDTLHLLDKTRVKYGLRPYEFLAFHVLLDEKTKRDNEEKQVRAKHRERYYRSWTRRMAKVLPQVEQDAIGNWVQVTSLQTCTSCGNFPAVCGSNLRCIRCWYLHAPAEASANKTVKYVESSMELQ